MYSYRDYPPRLVEVLFVYQINTVCTESKEGCVSAVSRASSERQLWVYDSTREAGELSDLFIYLKPQHEVCGQRLG